MCAPILRTKDLQTRIEAHRRFSERDVDFFAWVVEHVPWQGGEQVLDVGCGTGVYLPYYRRYTPHMTALDLSPEMVVQVRAQWPDVDVLVANAMHLPFPSASFDVAFANHVLFFVPDINRALREIHRILRPGGWFVAATNAQKALHRLHTLHAAALRSIGRRPHPLRHVRFALENGRALVAAVFGTAEVQVMDNAFCFPTVDDAMKYYLSGEVNNVEGAPLTSAERHRVLTMMREHIAAIIRQEGVFRVPKPSGVILARRESDHIGVNATNQPHP